MSSGAIMPARAPPSIDMLQMVMRSSMSSARIAAPVYSNTWPVPPPTPIFGDQGEDDVLRRHAAAKRGPPRALRSVLALRCSRHCVASTCSTSLVPMPNASAPNAPWVEVWLSPHTIVMPGWVSPSSGPMTCTMPRCGDRNPVQRNAERPAVVFELLHLPGRHLVEDRQRAVGGRDAVIHGRHRPIRTAHLEPALAQAGERLRRGDLVNQVEVDVEDRRRARVLSDDVGIPDFLEERARHMNSMRKACAGLNSPRDHNAEQAARGNAAPRLPSRRILRMNRQRP